MGSYLLTLTMERIPDLGFTSYDRFCPFYKTTWMVKNIVTFYNLAVKAVEAQHKDTKMTWNSIRDAMGDTIIYRLTAMKFIEPSEGKAAVEAKLQQLHDDIISAFRNLEDAN